MTQIWLIAAAFIVAGATVYAQDDSDGGPMASGIHQFTMQDIEGNDVPLSAYDGQVLLVVNTASKCGYTPQYEGMQELYDAYKDQGFTVLAFPANNFGAQEPGTNEEILDFCTTNYHTTFDLFSKISVKGGDIHPLYAWLTTESGFPGDIKWNFNKFLVDKNGAVVARFDSGVTPMSNEITTKVEELLAE
ncbi:MAG: glutathione peroxidase [Ectothiorhodospiraceae bacterium]|nr:glutathione peroxidase [Ectothiorhodospiraceae bacterium]